MNRIIRWQEPPESRHHRDRKPRLVEASPWTDVAAGLKARPGEWAVVYEGNQGTASSHAQAIKQGTGQGVAFAPRGAFDALTRSRHGVACTYARFLGETPP